MPVFRDRTAIHVPGQQEPVQLDPYRPWLEAGTLNLPTT